MSLSNIFHVRPKQSPMMTVRLTPKNLEAVAEWVSGHVKGTKLPPDQRVVEWYDQAFSGDTQVTAEVGQYIIKYGINSFSVVNEDTLNKLFTRVDTTGEL